MTYGEYLVRMKDAQVQEAVRAEKARDWASAEFHSKAAEGFNLRMLNESLENLMKKMEDML